MKKILILPLIMFIFISCGNKDRQKNNEERTANATEKVIDVHSSRNSLDYAGTYQGTIPCADCSGIELAITLDNKGAYTQTMTYIGKGPENVFKTSGTYEWDSSGSKITIKSGDEVNMYLVGENALFILDESGNRITGDLADKYILRKAI
ncbi:copper resistance protein NlpE [Bacteroides sp. 224]|uniref:copper resistance protein NlpE n=1 Tax=Bacteroides sp. 224 TaxID=2302936 RepID=UPI0013D75EDA|nr:copper resistance protein NlpE [Bacteroides sp. 224]NDV66966.1 copper resistance protein NlpE [Bacteroides sp. 224]